MRGFTLIEAVIYLALFSVLMTAGLLSLYSIEQSAFARSKATTLAQESSFIEAKIDWAVKQATAIDEPRQGQGSTLKLKTHLGEITITEVKTALMLQSGSEEALPLTSKQVSVEGLSFSTIIDSRDTIIGVATRFTMNGTPFEVRSYFLP